MEEHCKAKTGEGVWCSRAAKYNGYCSQHNKLKSPKTSPKKSPIKKSPTKSPKRSPAKIILPADMLNVIFSNMDFNTTIKMCQTDKQWLQICKNNPCLLADVLVREGIPVNRKDVLPTTTNEWVTYYKTNKKAMKFVKGMGKWNEEYGSKGDFTVKMLFTAFPTNKVAQKLKKEWRGNDLLFGVFKFDSKTITFRPFDYHWIVALTKTEFINGLARLYAKYPKFKLKRYYS